MRGRAGLVVLVAVVLAGAAACTSGKPASRRSAPSASASGGEHAGHTTILPPGRMTPEQMRGQFEQYLGQHSLLAVRLMRSVVSGQPDLRQATGAALQDNTGVLSQLVARAYGTEQAARFQQLWQSHIADLESYARGVATGDATERQQARSELIGYGNAYGSWFAAASKGRVRAADAAAALHMHVEDLMRQIDVYAAGDRDQAYQLEREAYEHMFAAGATFARASVTPELAVGVDTPPNRLRSAFAMLLGEHLELVIEAQRATFAGSPEFKAAAAQINVNTSALARGMAAIVGPTSAAEFQAAWADHVDGLMAYTAASAGDDDAGKVAAQKELNSYAVTLAAYFSRVVRNPADLVPLTGALTMHDRHLIEQVEAYAARDYTKAQRMELEGYQQMLGVADTLVSDIQRTVAPTIPVGGAGTGGGGTARRSHRSH